MTAQATHYPTMPPRYDGESDGDYTNRLTGYTEAQGGEQRPYDHRRYRQCSIGWHAECSQRVDGTTIGATGDCECPHHTDPRLAAALPHVVAFFRSTTDATGEVLRAITSEAVDMVIKMLAAADRAGETVAS